MTTKVSYLKSANNSLYAESGIIKANEYMSIVEAQDIVSFAQAQAEDIRIEAKRLAAQEIARGYQAGKKAAQQDIAEQLITAKIRSNQMMEQAESDLISLVKLTTERLFGQLSDVDKLAGMIQSGLSSMRSDYRVQVRVVPEMEAEITQKMPALIHDLKFIEYFEVITDTSLKKDECILEGDGGLIKCSISNQLIKLNSLIEHAMGTVNDD